MVTPTRIDQRQGSQTALGRRPIVLAQLPRVGATVKFQPQAPEAPPVQEFTSAPVAPEPEVERPVSLRIDTPAPSIAQQQIAEEVEHFSSQVSRRSTSSGRSSSQVATSPLLQLHSRVAPHAGLIVALALIASAGLLYWLMIAPTQLPAPTHFYHDGPQFMPEGFGQADVEQPLQAAVLPQEPVFPAQSSLSITEPEPETDSKPALDFPKTSRSTSLDFSQIGDVLPEKSEAAVPEPLPVVGQRPSFDADTPTIKR